MSGPEGPAGGRFLLSRPGGRGCAWAADLVLPVGAPSIARGAVLAAEGRVAALGPAEEILPCAPPGARRDFGRAILIPGLVDAHTHLELAGLRLPPAPMADWVAALVRETRGWSSSLFLASARVGAAGTLAAGVTCVGDVTASGESPAAIAEAGLRGVAFHEALGLDGDRADEILARRLEVLERSHAYRGVLPGQPGAGLSPHAPYTTSPELYRALLRACRERGLPAATHLAESPEEVRFLREGGGDFGRMHHELGSPAGLFHPPGCSPVEHLEREGALVGLQLAVHCNQTGPADWERLRRAGVWVCLCPGSARFFGHPLADAAGMRRAGLSLCLGTDSRASHPSFSLLAEAAALNAAGAGLGAEELLRLCTLGGAEALGLAGEGAGQLRAEGPADFAVVEPPAGIPLAAEALFHPESRVVCTVTGGEARFTAASPAD